MSRAPQGRRAGRRTLAACLLALALGTTLLVTGLTREGRPANAAPPVHLTTTTAATPPGTAPVRPLPAARPVRVRIPAAGVDTGPVLDLGLAADGTVEVPPVRDADRIGWYDKGVTPGETGPAVLIGHYDTVQGPAVMKNVARVRPGDRVYVDRADGTTAAFAIRAIQQVDKSHFPTRQVYGDTPRPELRLITCGGDLRAGHRPDNVILYADLLPQGA
ncbi:peptidase C60 [Streptomyces sp. NRRL F-4489]|uniref:class F sortase n=1 Tax=Streptomyces sp. NRRL F-4489 TaxID=1609095 RepID=UPI000746ECF5|nr:class F sortase [Streptomyces sp. NRRL F-4489]KUL38630.1 peptidase C60 [Streptomyces sp. NRRL F-4489]